uniref:Uncharacterized protein n=1 Tax=Timema monikensis TaxID=170555 RepID=A0A7R9EHA4_9NEOP|nr:unnamed protein product [Timema monikensis]
MARRNPSARIRRSLKDTELKTRSIAPHARPRGESDIGIWSKPVPVSGSTLVEGTNGPRPSYGVGPGSGGLQPSKPGGPRGPVGGMAQSQPLANSTAPAQGYRGSWGNPYTSLRYPSPNMGGPVPTTASYTTSYSHHQASVRVKQFSSRELYIPELMIPQLNLACYPLW